jgi:hypothetical protein
MSCDETDDEADEDDEKRLIHYHYDWLDAGITQFAHELDHKITVYNKSIIKNQLRGHRPLRRKKDNVQTRSDFPVATGLPSNWYNQEWLAKQPAALRLEYDIKPPRHAPVYLSSFFFDAGLMYL